jgi:hypothetical protein
LLEFGNSVLRGDLGALGFLLEEGIDVKTRERFLCLTQALTAFGFGWD